MKVKDKSYRTIWMEDNVVKMINQPKIPHQFEILEFNTYKQVAQAIKAMIIRGAPAIGAAGAYGMALAALEAADDQMAANILAAAEELRSTRPTAKDLFTGIDCVVEVIMNCDSPDEVRKQSVIAANKYADASVESCRKIGEYGAELIKSDYKVLTHCNAGWLACVDWGTAPSAIYQAHRAGKNVFVYVDETRPRCQGSRLTAWEMLNEGVPHKVICDNAAAYYMQKGVDLVITGADRIACNGDAANKIGTFEKAIIAKELGIPFYVAAPLTTFDINAQSGKSIPIEERSEDEVRYMFGIDDQNKMTRVKVAPDNSTCGNPAFDITPAKYITGIITEKGIIQADTASIEQLFKK
jgi:S-methyl-5-thioribose-1-phosphate isomerase